MSEVPTYALALLSIFGGASLTALAGLIGVVVQTRREHQQWLRAQRAGAFADALAFVHQTHFDRFGFSLWGAQVSSDSGPWTKLTNAQGEKADWSARPSAAVEAALGLYGTRRVARLFGIAHRSAISESWDEAQMALVGLEEEMRRALGVQRHRRYSLDSYNV